MYNAVSALMESLPDCMDGGKPEKHELGEQKRRALRLLFTKLPFLELKSQFLEEQGSVETRQQSPLAQH